MLAVPGKQPPLPSDPSGTFADVDAQPAVPVGKRTVVGVASEVESASGASEWAYGVGVGVAVCVGVGVEVGLDDGDVAVTVAVTVTMTLAVTLTVTVEVAVAVTVTVPFGGRGEMQTTMIRAWLWGRDFTGSSTSCRLGLLGRRVDGAHGEADDDQDSGQSGDGGALGCHGSLSCVPHTPATEVASPRIRLKGRATAAMSKTA